MHPMNVPAKFLQSVALPVPELIGDSQKMGRSLAMSTLYPPAQKYYMLTIHYRLFIYVHSFSRDFRLQF